MAAALASFDRFSIVENEQTLKSLLELYVPLESRDPVALANRKRIDGIQEVRADPPTAWCRACSCAGGRSG